MLAQQIEPHMVRAYGRIQKRAAGDFALPVAGRSSLLMQAPHYYWTMFAEGYLLGT